MVQIQNATGFLSKERIARPDPASIAPGSNRIGTEPAPNGGSANRGHETPSDRFVGDVLVAETRERQAQLLGQFTSQRLYFHDQMRGEKRRGLPRRGRSSRPAKRSSKNRFRQRHTI